VIQEELTSFEALRQENELVDKVMTPEMAAFMFDNNKFTVSNLEPQWNANMRKNIKFYNKHGSILDSFGGFGKNKAVIGVGAGPSFNINRDVLKEIYNYNLMFPLEEQPFIIIASNKQFKPLLEMGVYPHMTILIDAGDALYPQLCEGIPDHAKKSILIAGLHASPKIIEQWDKQGGEICFYLIGGDKNKEYFEKKTGQDAELVRIQQGGNVLNTLWILAYRYLHSTVFIAVGNDMAFSYSKNKAQRRKSFYADGDYILNIKNLRDEAKEELGWPGFHNLQQSDIAPNTILYDLEPMGTSKLLWIYKLWMETQIVVWSDQKPFHYYNCSESGILGVLAREYKAGKYMGDKDNWYLMDEVIPKRWHTRTLKQAFQEFVEAKLWLKQNQNEGILTGVGSAVGLPDQTNIARTIVRAEKERLTGSGIIL